MRWQEWYYLLIVADFPYKTYFSWRCEMKAVVKDIPVGTLVRGVYFVEQMRKFVGREIDVRPSEETGGWKGWYDSIVEFGSNDFWMWHKSWLTFPK